MWVLTASGRWVWILDPETEASIRAVAAASIVDDDIQGRDSFYAVDVEYFELPANVTLNGKRFAPQPWCS